MCIFLLSLYRDDSVVRCKQWQICLTRLIERYMKCAQSKLVEDTVKV